MIEWEANSPTELQSKLPQMYDLLVNNKTTMKLMSSSGVLPGTNSNSGARGTYNPLSQTCQDGCGINGSGCGYQGNDVDVNRCKMSTPTSLTGGELNGEKACENHGYTETECYAVGDGSCCHWGELQCWSSIGTAICPGTDPNSTYTKSTTLAFVQVFFLVLVFFLL